MIEHQEIIKDNPPSNRKLGAERLRTAASVHDNSEWRDYIASTLDTLRTQALMEETTSDVSGDMLKDRLLVIRGKILALTDIYNYFLNCHNAARREADKSSNE